MKKVVLNKHVLPLHNWSRAKMADISGMISSKTFLNANTRVSIFMKFESPRFIRQMNITDLVVGL